MRKGKRYKTLYLPALTIVAAVLALLIVIAVSTYRNLTRERSRMEDSFLQEGLVIGRAIEASVRAEFPATSPDISRVRKIIEEVSRDPGIARIVLFDGAGNITASGPTDGAPEKITDVPSLLLLLNEKGTITRYSKDNKGESTFELIKPFRPLAYRNPLAREGEEKIEPREESLHRWAKDKLISVQLRLGPFESARRQDIHHSLLMGSILVILGGGALYFIFVLQNYYLVDRSLAEMRTYTENLVESMADGLVSIDNEKRIVTANRRAAEFLSEKGKSLKGIKISEALGEKAERLLEENKLMIRGQEIEVQRRSEGSIPLSLSAAPLRDERGREMGSVLLLRDLREIRDLQEKVRRSERLASLGRLAAGMAHEIRNPLSSIRGFAQYFMNRFRGHEEEQGYASVMVKEVDRLNRVVTDLLDFARPKEPHRELHRLENILSHSAKLLEGESRKKGVQLEEAYEPDVPPARVDRDQLAQAFLNLLLNSLESIDGGGKIRIGLKRGNNQDDVEVAIADTGRGIPPEDLGKVFEPFFTTKRGGTGLGLAIVQQIVESHGGEIAVESTEGLGTTFRITLPIG